jgi:hypothetical protein
MLEKYGLSSIDQAYNSNKTWRRHKLTRYGFSKNIFHKKSMLNVCCWKWSNVFYWFHAKLQGFLDNYVCSLIGEGMYVNTIAFRPTLWRVKIDFVIVGVGKDFGQVWQTTFKTTTYRKINIQLPCGTKGVSHGEICAWFESAWNFAIASTCDGR